MTTLTRAVYAVVRCTEGKAWLDLATIDPLRESAQDKADATDRLIPSWAKVNPQVRLERCLVHVEHPAP
jgi:hypothetical protein